MKIYEKEIQNPIQIILETEEEIITIINVIDTLIESKIPINGDYVPGLIEKIYNILEDINKRQVDERIKTYKLCNFINNKNTL